MTNKNIFNCFNLNKILCILTHKHMWINSHVFIFIIQQFSKYNYHRQYHANHLSQRLSKLYFLHNSI